MNYEKNDEIRSRADPRPGDGSEQPFLRGLLQKTDHRHLHQRRRIPYRIHEPAFQGEIPRVRNQTRIYVQR